MKNDFEKDDFAIQKEGNRIQIWRNEHHTVDYLEEVKIALIASGAKPNKTNA